MEIHYYEDMWWSVKKSMNGRNIRAQNILEVFCLIDNVEKHLFVFSDSWFFERFYGYIGIFLSLFRQVCLPILTAQQRS